MEHVRVRDRLITFEEVQSDRILPWRCGNGVTEMSVPFARIQAAFLAYTRHARCQAATTEEPIGRPGDPTRVRVGIRAARDPDRHSTWNTIDSTVDVDEVLDEDDLENFFVEPIPDPLNPEATRGSSE